MIFRRKSSAGRKFFVRELFFVKMPEKRGIALKKLDKRERVCYTE